MRDKEHEERKAMLKNFPDREILLKALDIAMLTDDEKEALQLYIFKGVPISIIAERMGYERSYFSAEKFKRILIKYAYCVRKIAKENSEG